MNGLAARLARPEILALAPFDIGARGDPVASDLVHLDANENPFPPLGSSPLETGINRYPEPQPARLRRLLASLYSVDPDRLLLTRGADDGIDLLVRTFCRAGQDKVLVASPTFSAFAHFARLQGAQVVETRLDANFDLDADSFIAAARAQTSLKLAFICSPNNPTGNIVPIDTIRRILDALPDTLIVLDEAYIEFADCPSLSAETAERANLVVLRTLSKAYGLAGARVGALVGHRELVEIVGRALPPYPLPTLSGAAALAALAPARRPIHADRIQRLRAERERVAERLESSPWLLRVHRGGGNFLFLEAKDPSALAARLDRLGISARFRESAAPGGVRITIGTPEENDLLLRALDVGGERPAGRRAELSRETRETRIAVSVDLDRDGPRRIDTGIAFYDHMLDQVAAHGGFSLILSCAGDLDIDGHHSIEDCALAFGAALAKALGDRRGIGRFGFALPMDEAQARIAIDLSGRAFSRFDGHFASSHIGAYPTEMTPHVFRSLADSLGASIHVEVTGDNDHHKTEACFKALGRALREAIRRDGSAMPSTKGSL